MKLLFNFGLSDLLCAKQMKAVYYIMTDSLSSYSDIQKSHKLIIFVSESTFIQTSLVIKVIG